MNEINKKRSQRREPYHFDTNKQEYIACIRVLLANKEVPLETLQLIYHILMQA